mmetsp:Transcript_91523/g.262113  ORF Transcript_91523/g.262113 Transcript_91523/m.262113 type:complete len:232 (+) Transcript_91523:308-1003(+)
MAPPSRPQPCSAGEMVKYSPKDVTAPTRGITDNPHCWPARIVSPTKKEASVKHTKLQYGLSPSSPFMEWALRGDQHPISTPPTTQSTMFWVAAPEAAAPGAASLSEALVEDSEMYADSSASLVEASSGFVALRPASCPRCRWSRPYARALATTPSRARNTPGKMRAGCPLRSTKYVSSVPRTSPVPIQSGKAMERPATAMPVVSSKFATPNTLPAATANPILLTSTAGPPR